MSIFFLVAERTIPGDTIVLPGGAVSYYVDTVHMGPDWQGVRAKRTAITRNSSGVCCSTETMEDISISAWRDLVGSACSAGRRS